MDNGSFSCSCWISCHVSVGHVLFDGQKGEMIEAKCAFCNCNCAFIILGGATALCCAVLVCCLCRDNLRVLVRELLSVPVPVPVSVAVPC